MIPVFGLSFLIWGAARARGNYGPSQFEVEFLHRRRAHKRYQYFLSNPDEYRASEEHAILSRNNAFYRHLDFAHQLLFFRKVDHFIRCKRFLGVHGLELTQEMIITISGKAVQLMFRLDDFLILPFTTIMIFPNKYKLSPRQRHWMKGHVSKTGHIGFSWKHLQEGYEAHDDGVHLGLHEFAHALELTFHKGYIKGPLLKREFPIFLRRANSYLQSEASDSSPIRDYGLLHVREFFPVLCEHFFERPHEIREQMPEYFAQLVKMLGVNPENAHNNFAP